MNLILFLHLNSGESKEFHLHLDEANSRIEWMWQMYMKYMLFGFAINSIAMATFSVLACCFVYGAFDKDHLFHSCILR